MKLPDDCWDEMDAWTPGAGAKIKLPERIEKLLAEADAKRAPAEPEPPADPK